MQRVVVTRLGAVTPLAAGVEASWSRHLPGRSGIRTLPNEVGLEPSYTILELTDQVALPTLNLTAPDPAYDGMDLVANQTTKQMDNEISNGFGFGRANASELFRRWTGKPADASGSLASYSCFPNP
jgi:3-oxoacyl-[acyl-carrier-protein] synthase II